MANTSSTCNRGKEEACEYAEQVFLPSPPHCHGLIFKHAQLIEIIRALSFFLRSFDLVVVVLQSKPTLL